LRQTIDDMCCGAYLREEIVRRIIVATSNQGKMHEIREILNGTDVELLSLKDVGLNPHIEETGETFEENAIIKAKAVMELTGGEIVMADDSGLEVDYLNKAPGVYSARFLGENTSYAIKNQYILDQLTGVEEAKRSARFVCVIACAYPDGEILTFRGTIEGRIADKICGTNGFGYDPIFYVSQYNCTTAEMQPQQKNQISHRAQALKAMKEMIMK
jgi:XTP/dITP diphosphohydrolase